MRSFIAALLPLAAAAPAGLTARNTTTCTSRSFSDFSWTVSDFTYNASYVFSTPAHQVDGGFAGFTLTNPAIPETVSCSAYSLQLEDYFYGNINYDCVAANGSSTKSSFAFSSPARSLAVNQTWTCSEDPTTPTTFTARGSIELPYACKEDDYQNPDWQTGEIYSSRLVNCGPVTLPLKPQDKNAVA
ncbi:hypothetical protein F4861DRAFT_404655 [Xylaria intraflava]|nr:hypothetical protein F4861DRAFT_404655 [Xylaria intraflava]